MIIWEVVKQDEEKQGHTGRAQHDRDMNTETMELRHRTHVSTSCRVAPPVQGPTPRLNMAIVQLNTGDENLQGWR